MQDVRNSDLKLYCKCRLCKSGKYPLMPINAYVDEVGRAIVCGARLAEICEAEGYRKIPDIDTLVSTIRVAPFTSFLRDEWPAILAKCDA